MLFYQWWRCGSGRIRYSFSSDPDRGPTCNNSYILYFKHLYVYFYLFIYIFIFYAYLMMNIFFQISNKGRIRIPFFFSWAGSGVKVTGSSSMLFSSFGSIPMKCTVYKCLNEGKWRSISPRPTPWTSSALEYPPEQTPCLTPIRLANIHEHE